MPSFSRTPGLTDVILTFCFKSLGRERYSYLLFPGIKLYGATFLKQSVEFKSNRSWFDVGSKLNLLGTPLKFVPTRYGNTGLLKFKNGPAESTVNVLMVAK